jgi:hypothetical protein
VDFGGFEYVDKLTKSADPDEGESENENERERE